MPQNTMTFCPDCGSKMVKRCLEKKEDNAMKCDSCACIWVNRGLSRRNYVGVWERRPILVEGVPFW